MLDNLTYKQKFFYLLYSILFVFILSYLLSIKNTIQVVSEYKQMNNELKRFNETIVDLSTIKHELNNLDKKINAINSNEKTIQYKIMNNVASYCETNNLYIKNITSPITVKMNNCNIETRILLVKGNFIELLQLSYLIEQKYKIGKISSLRFFKERNNESNADELLMEVYLQNVINS